MMSIILRFPNGKSLEISKEICLKWRGTMLEKAVSPEWKDDEIVVSGNLRRGFKKLVEFHNGSFDALDSCDLYDVLEYIGFGPQIRSFHEGLFGVSRVIAPKEIAMKFISPQYIDHSPYLQKLKNLVRKGFLDDPYITIFTDVLSKIRDVLLEELKESLRKIKKMAEQGIESETGVEVVKVPDFKFPEELGHTIKVINETIEISKIFFQLVINSFFSEVRYAFFQQAAHDSFKNPTLSYRILMGNIDNFRKIRLLSASVMTCYSYRTVENQPLWEGVQHSPETLSEIVEMLCEEIEDEDNQPTSYTYGYEHLRIRRKCYPKGFVDDTNSTPIKQESPPLIEYPHHQPYLKLVLIGGMPYYLEIFGETIPLNHSNLLKGSYSAVLDYIAILVKYPQLAADGRFRKRLSSFLIATDRFLRLTPMTPQTFSTDPHGAWCFYPWRKKKISKVPKFLQENFIDTLSHKAPSLANCNVWEDYNEKYLPYVDMLLKKHNEDYVVIHPDMEYVNSIREFLPDYHPAITTSSLGFIRV